MSYQLIDCYCGRCKTGTPHEHDPETGKSACTLCVAKKRTFALPPQRSPETVLAQHLSALDGMGNRGPTAYERRRNR